MKTLQPLLTALLLLVILSCGNSQMRHAEIPENAMYEEVPIALESQAQTQTQTRTGAETGSDNTFISSSAAVETNGDNSRRFIRTADLKFKVKNVIRSTYDIENITVGHGGFVVFTNLKSTVTRADETAISVDSTLETTHYTVTNMLVLRVPNVKLDTTLKDISRNIDFLDYRVIRADDVALKVLSNELAQKRSKENEERLKNAIDNRGRRLNETTSAEELLLRKQEQADNARIENLSLEDQISFSTINLRIYQRPSLKREVIANEKSIDEYKPGFGKKIAEAVKSGWNVLEEVVVLLVNIWWLILLAVAGCFVFRWYRKRNKKE